MPQYRSIYDDCDCLTSPRLAGRSLRDLSKYSFSSHRHLYASSSNISTDSLHSAFEDDRLLCVECHQQCE